MAKWKPDVDGRMWHQLSAQERKREYQRQYTRRNGQSEAQKAFWARVKAFDGMCKGQISRPRNLERTGGGSGSAATLTKKLKKYQAEHAMRVARINAQLAAEDLRHMAADEARTGGPAA